jgi:hypothetical protein
LPDKSSKYADHGTACHELAAKFLGPNFLYSRNHYKAENGVELDYDDISYVVAYADQVKDYTGAGTLLVEQQVDYSEAIGVPDSFGTSDAIIISEDGEELIILDLKMGKGISVDADENPQLMLYAVGALNEYGLVYDIKRVRLVISQPRLNHLSEWSCTVEDLMEFADKAKRSAQIAYGIYKDGLKKTDDMYFSPSEKACRFCKAKSICPALNNFVQQEIESGFENIADELPVSTVIDTLAQKMKAIPLIEAWCKSIRGAVEAELLQGKSVDGFKLVRGKAGNRKWTDEKAAEETLKSFRLKQEEMYTFDLISPTAAEKLLKDNPRRWVKVEELITRGDGKISVASVDDKRPALDVTDVEAGFDVINNEEGEL